MKKNDSSTRNRKATNGLKRCIKLLEKGKALEASVIASKVVKLNPHLAIGHLVRGRAYLEGNRFDDAIKSTKRAIAISETGEAYATLARAYDCLGKVRDTFDCHTKAMELDPKSPSIKNAAANFMLNNGMLNDAERLFRHTASLGDSNGLNGILLLLDRRGEYEEAIDIIRENQQIIDGSDGLRKIHAKILLAMDKALESLAILNKLDSDNMTPNNAVDYFHLLGDVHHELESFDAAFRSYTKANNLRNINYDSSQFEREISLLVKKFPFRETFEDIPRSNNLCKRPIFVLGMPRTGTSLLEQVLAMHSEVYGAGELDDINELSLNYDNNDSESLNIAASIYESKLSSIDSDSRYVTDKMPHNILNAGFIAQLFSNAKLIYCTRDPNDVMISCFRRNFHGSHSYATNLDSIKHYMSQIDHLMSHWKQVLPLPIFELNYEDFIADPKPWLQSVLTFLGLDWEESLLDFHKSDRQINTASYSQVRKPLYNSSINNSYGYRQYF